MRVDTAALVPQGAHDMAEILTSDHWMQAICAMILKQQAVCGLGEIAESLIGVSFSNKSKSFRRRIVSTLASSLHKFRREDDGFLFSTYLPFLQEKRLEFLLGQCPQVWGHEYIDSFVPIDSDARVWELELDAENDFERFIFEIIPSFIPTHYLEGYNELINRLTILPWPSRPKYIFSSNCLWYDTVAMAYIAAATEKGSALIYGQHGGHYEMGLHKWMEAHELAVADRYISWGWSESELPELSSKIRPLGAIKTPPNGFRRKNPRDILVVFGPVRKYVFRLQCDKFNMLEYIQTGLAFAQGLEGTDAYSALRVRLYPHDYGWGECEFWREAHPSVRLDLGATSIWDRVRCSKLVVYAYNSTGYLEFMMAGVPCLVLFDDSSSPLRETSVLDFEELRKVGVYHTTAESAANHIRSIWPDVDGWWWSDEVQNVVSGFKEKYCKQIDDLLPQIKRVLIDTVAEVADKYGSSSNLVGMREEMDSLT